MSDAPPTGSTQDSPRATITPRDPPTVEEMDRRIGLTPVERKLRDLENAIALARQAEQKALHKRYTDLGRRRRRVKARVGALKQELRDEERELADIDREMKEIRLPPGQKLTDE